MSSQVLAEATGWVWEERVKRDILMMYALVYFNP